MKPTLVVLAGGMGSRYGGLKQLEGVGPDNETIIDYSAFDAIRVGFKKIVFVVSESTVDDFRAQVTDRIAGFTEGQIVEHGSNENSRGHTSSAAQIRDMAKVEVEVVCQQIEPSIPGVGIVPRSKPWGTGHAVLAAKNVVDDPFAVINADDYYGIDSFRVMHKCLTERVSPVHYSMVGFELGKTLSSNGSVSRAVCELDNARRLKSVIERTQIIAGDNGIVDQSVSPPVELSPRDQVSMNFWGFHSSFFEALENSFIHFATDNQSDPAAEFYIPIIIEELLKADSVAVEVLSSGEQWYGLTYAEDREGLQRVLSQMTNDGLYASPLWPV